MSVNSGGEAIVSGLVAHGVDTVFGLPGAQIYGLFDAFHQAQLKVIGARPLTAFGGNEPVLCLTGQVPTAFLGKGRGHLHEMPDQLATMRTFVKWAERIEYPDAAPALVSRAFQEMLSGRRGPASLEMPWDVFTQKAEVGVAEVYDRFLPPQPDPDRIKS